MARVTSKADLLAKHHADTAAMRRKWIGDHELRPGTPRDDWSKHYGTRLFQAPADDPPDAHWFALMDAALDAIATVRTGKLEAEAAVAQLRDWAGRYFDTEDNQSRFSVQCVLTAFKTACGKRENR